MSAAEIPATARALTAQEQHFPIDSHSETLNLAINTAWAAEAKDRLAAYDRGEIQAAPVEDLFAKLRTL
jgi:Putative addiction module component